MIESGPISPFAAISTARCMAFSSSRTLPGQRLAMSWARASVERTRATPFALAYIFTKWSRVEHVWPGVHARRNLQVHDVEAKIEQVLAEFAFTHRIGRAQRFEVAMMRISIGTARVPPTRSDDALLDRAQELGCRPTSISEISSSSSVPPFRLFELADAARDRAVKRAFLVAEQLGFPKGVGDRAH